VKKRELSRLPMADRPEKPSDEALRTLREHEDEIAHALRHAPFDFRELLATLESELTARTAETEEQAAAFKALDDALFDIELARGYDSGDNNPRLTRGLEDARAALAKARGENA
jgi:hypothetical protein